jgi:hypothetical protein
MLPFRFRPDCAARAMSAFQPFGQKQTGCKPPEPAQAQAPGLNRPSDPLHPPQLTHYLPLAGLANEASVRFSPARRRMMSRMNDVWHVSVS